MDRLKVDVGIGVGFGVGCHKGRLEGGSTLIFRRISGGTIDCNIDTDGKVLFILLDGGFESATDPFDAEVANVREGLTIGGPL